jgi:hypothetical protein
MVKESTRIGEWENEREKVSERPKQCSLRDNRPTNSSGKNGGTSENHIDETSLRRNLLSIENRMSVGVSAERLSPALNGVRLLPKMAEKRDLVGNESSVAGKTSGEVRKSPTIDGSYCG